ncbi:hypothetical protein ACIBCR_01870 [Micromonospora echinospora]|uniref:hypothetical protein n=1 Tax=Micromonospora echinospora TaxID=1877 RepID=UPI0037894DE6
MTTPGRLRLAVSVLATAGAVLLGATTAAPVTPAPAGNRAACDPIDPTACLLLSPGSPILVRVPGVDVGVPGNSPVHEIARPPDRPNCRQANIPVAAFAFCPRQGAAPAGSR